MSLQLVKVHALLFTFGENHGIIQRIGKLEFVGGSKMATFITVSALGILISILGIINTTGNISSLHWYHRQRVTEENRKPFGKLVGLGTLIIGLAMIVFGILFLIFEQTQLESLVIIGVVELIASIIVGMVISFYAMKKYNGGIF